MIHDEEHSIFPTECVSGLVEITIYLDSRKLKDDIERMAPIKSMTKRRYLVPHLDTSTRVPSHMFDGVSPRSYVIGLPSDPNWNPKTIATALRKIQLEIGPPTHVNGTYVNGLYVLGIGYFCTIPVEGKNGLSYNIEYWTGPDRLFRFSNRFRQSFDRWHNVLRGLTVDLSSYIKGASKILSE